MNTNSIIEIKLCTKADLDILKKITPDPDYHEKRYAEQEANRASYLIVWQDDVPVGHLLIKWEGSGEQVSKYLPVTPEFNAFEVWPPSNRSKGIGSKVLLFAEQMAKQIGFNQVALAVEINNVRAKKLYVMRGYEDWGHGQYLDSWKEIDKSGKEIQHNNPCFYLVKKLD